MEDSVCRLQSHGFVFVVEILDGGRILRMDKEDLKKPALGAKAKRSRWRRLLSFDAMLATATCGVASAILNYKVSLLFFSAFVLIFSFNMIFALSTFPYLMYSNHKNKRRWKVAHETLPEIINDIKQKRSCNLAERVILHLERASDARTLPTTQIDSLRSALLPALRTLCDYRNSTSQPHTDSPDAPIPVKMMEGKWWAARGRIAFKHKGTIHEFSANDACLHFRDLHIHGDTLRTITILPHTGTHGDFEQLWAGPELEMIWSLWNADGPPSPPFNHALLNE